MRSVQRGVLSAAAAALVVVSACSGGESAAPTTTQAATTTSGAASTTTAAPAPVEEGCTDERKGGELTMVAGASVLTPGLDPIVALGASFGNTEMHAIYDSLMRYNPESGSVEPHVAESLEANADSTVFTMKLREGITFGNGDPLTSAAVVFSMERLAASPRVAAGMAREIESMETPDDLTVVFNLRSPWLGFPYLLAHSGGAVVNPAVVAERGDTFATNPLGAGVGPYEFVRYAAGEEVVLEAKDDYWGGPVCIETIRFVNVSGDTGRYDAFANDEIDGVFMTEPVVIASMRNDGVAEFAWAGTGRGFHLNSGRGDNPILADVRLRQAVAHALDLDALNTRVWSGAARMNAGITDPEQLMYTDVAPLAYEPDKAKALVSEYEAETGQKPSVNIVCSNTKENTDLAINVGAMLQVAGFDTVVENLAGNAANDRVLTQGTYDIGCAFVAIFDESPERGMGQYIGGSPRNRTGFANAEMDAAIARLNTVFDPKDRATVMGDLQELMNDLVPGVFYSTSEWYIGFKDQVKGIVPSIAGVLLFHEAWLDEN